MRYLIVLISIIAGYLITISQNKYAEVSRAFRDHIASYWFIMDNSDNITYILWPLNELSLDSNYIISDFRPYYRIYRNELKDITFLRLYAREKTKKRPDRKYFFPEYRRYQKCIKDSVPYVTDKDSVPFIPVFDHISLTGTEMSIWQAYLLDCSKLFFWNEKRGILWRDIFYHVTGRYR